MGVTRICAVLGLLHIVYSVTALSDFYCRDPDTGKLHAVNSTWPSTSFCGNYTCKLRKKIPIETQSVPIREFKVANNDVSEQTTPTPVSMVQSTLNLIPMEVIEKDEKIVLNESETKYVKDSNEIKNVELNGDRLLNENEIKTISQLLHTVKKSDLEAIVDIYNLAKDIYTEMDKVTSENIIEEAVGEIKNHNQKQTQSKADMKKNSYWYEPLQQQQKIKPVDMDHQGSDVAPVAVAPRQDAYPSSYFKGTLSTQDFGKLPYYYPMSSFQRQSSYVHPTYTASVYTSQAPKLCDQQPKANPIQPSFGGVIMKPFSVESKKFHQPVLLPYPFSYMQRYNTTAYPQSVYYDANPLAHFDVYNRYYQAYQLQVPNYVTAYPYAETKNNKPSEENPKDLLETLTAKLKEESKKTSEWQTDSLSNHVLEEVRAHFEEKAKLLKPLSLRKKVKLERVGKVIKLDELNRNKRSIDILEDKKDDDEIYEVYMERTTCESDVAPGFFRVGNLSEPYPACCPQRISRR